MNRPLRPQGGGEEPSLDRAARMWADDEALFEEATPPAAINRRPDLAALNRRPAPVSVPPPAPSPPAASPVPTRRPVEGERAQPLRIYMGALGSDGAAPKPPGTGDAGEPIWDAAAIAQRSLEAGRAQSPGRNGALPDDEDSVDGRSSGELPRTWLDPARLPAALDRAHGARPRRVGGVVQPVPGTPSALAIAREEAESARFGPPPPLPSTMPLLIGRGWAAPEEAVDGPDLRVGGFQLVHEIPQANAPREASPPTPATSPRTDRPATPPPTAVKAAQRPGSARTLAVWGGVGAAVTVVVLGVLFLLYGAQLRVLLGRTPSEVTPPPTPPEAPPVVPSEKTPEPPATPPVTVVEETPPEPPVEPPPAPVEVPPVAVEPAQRPCEAEATEALTGLITITSNLPGSVSIDGHVCGKVPMAPLRVKLGNHAVKVTTRHGTQLQQMRVDAERPTNVDFKF